MVRRVDAFLSPKERDIKYDPATSHMHLFYSVLKLTISKPLLEHIQINASATSIFPGS